MKKVPPTKAYLTVDEVRYRKVQLQSAQVANERVIATPGDAPGTVKLTVPKQVQVSVDDLRKFVGVCCEEFGES